MDGLWPLGWRLDQKRIAACPSLSLRSCSMTIKAAYRQRLTDKIEQLYCGVVSVAYPQPRLLVHEHMVRSPAKLASASAVGSLLGTKMTAAGDPCSTGSRKVA